MRWVISGILLLSGTILLFLLSAGAFVNPDALLSSANPDPWKRALSPIWTMGWQGSAVLIVGSILVICGVSLIFWAQPDQKERRQPWRVARVLQSALTLNVTLAALLMLTTSLALRNAAPTNTVGHLFALTGLVIVAGSALVFALFWQAKPRWLFCSLLTIHLLEAGAVGTVFANGYGG